MSARPFHLFDRFGVEIEYMIVDAGTLDVLPVADRLIRSAGGARKNEIRRGNARWSNELVLHVIEIKTDGPARALDGLEAVFQGQVRHLNGMLRRRNARLLPTAMHPWMDPHRETRLWPHGDRTIYETFHRIFDCRGHGWSNLQSTHLNLPFHGDDEFRRLHTAIRLILPLLPALAASSPFADGRPAPVLDMRLEAYRHNCDRIPSITARLVPEWIGSRARYETRILDRIRRDVRPFDPDGVLCAEWVNARGAIARFDRGAIEIRVLDTQECPRADLAILRFIVAALRSLVDETLSPCAAQKRMGTVRLEHIFLDAVRDAERAVIDDPEYLHALGFDGVARATCAETLRALLARVVPAAAPERRDLEFILRRGSLARRIRRAAGRRPGRTRLREIYEKLADCLDSGDLFDA